MRLYFFRGPGPDFSERDRDLLTLLRPHLHQAYLDAERRRHPTPQLTPRHWELLHLLAAGHTNAQIARRLGLSEGTVRTHLENIYARLQVSSRTAAVTRAFPRPRGRQQPQHPFRLINGSTLQITIHCNRCRDAHICRIEFVILVAMPIAGRGGEGDRQSRPGQSGCHGVLAPYFRSSPGAPLRVPGAS